MFKISYTIYPATEPSNTRIGIAIPPTPSLSYLELCDLLHALERAERDMRARLSTVKVEDLK